MGSPLSLNGLSYERHCGSSLGGSVMEVIKAQLGMVASDGFT
jgi:hypothetical protein